MTFIDVKTIFIVYIMSSALCAFVMASLWLQNRKRSPEIALWLVNFALQFIAILLVTLRGVVPDLASIVLANIFIIGGTVILYIGLERYVRKESRQWHNYVMLIVFTLVHAYLTFVYPSLTLRNVNLSFGLLYISVQVSWLMLRRIEPEMRPATRATGVIFAMFSLVSLARIVVDLVGPQANDVFKSGLFDTMVILTWQILFIALTFALFLMVSRRLLTVLESELVERKQAEEKERLLLNSTAEAIYGIDLQGNCTFANPSCARMLGYTSTEELLGKNMHNLIHHSYPDGSPMPVEVCRIYKAFLVGEGVHVDDEVLWKKDDSSFPVEYWSYPQKVNDVISGAVVTFIDITKRKYAEERLRRSEERYRNILENILEGYFESNLKGDIVFANNSAFVMMGYDKENLYKINYRQFSTPATKKKFQETYGEVFRTGIPSKMSDYKIIRGDGIIRINELSVALLRDSKGNPTGFRTVARDITEKKQAEKLIQIRLSLLEFSATHSLEELLQKTLDEVGILVDSPIGFYHFVEKDQNTLSLQAWSTRTLNEFCKAEGKGMHYGIDQAGVWVDCVRERRAVVHNDYNSLPHRKGMPEGHAAVIRELVVPIMRGKNIVAILGVGNKPVEYTQKDIEIVSYLADVAWEIAERKKTEEKIEHMATHDSLTDLPTLKLAEDRLAMAMGLASRHKEMVAVMFIDLDNFKTVNDTLGHNAGDYLLQQVAKRLLSCVRKTDTVARVGGDEFLLITSELHSSDDAAQMAEEVIRLVAQPVVIDGRSAVTSASIGIAFYPDHGDNIDQLIKLADEAMYRIKNAGKNGFGFANAAIK